MTCVLGSEKYQQSINKTHKGLKTIPVHGTVFVWTQISFMYVKNYSFAMQILWYSSILGIYKGYYYYIFFIMQKIFLQHNSFLKSFIYTELLCVFSLALSPTERSPLGKWHVSKPYIDTGFGMKILLYGSGKKIVSMVRFISSWGKKINSYVCVTGIGLKSTPQRQLKIINGIIVTQTNIAHMQCLTCISTSDTT